MKGKKLKFILISWILIFGNFIFLESVVGEYGSSYTGAGGSSSASCGSSTCAGTLYYDDGFPQYGIKATLINKNTFNSIGSVRIWREKNGSNVKNPNNSSSFDENTIFFEDDAKTYLSGRYGCKDQQSVPYCYIKYLDKVMELANETSSNTIVLENILNKINSKNNLHVSNYADYYLLIEPLIARTYTLWGYRQPVVSGTLNEIVDSFKKYTVDGGRTYEACSNSDTCSGYGFIEDDLNNEWHAITNNYKYIHIDLDKLKKLLSREQYQRFPYKETFNSNSAIKYAEENNNSVYGKALITYLDKIQSSCESEFNSLNNYGDLQLRYKLYKKYYDNSSTPKDGYGVFNNLFNLNLGQGDGNLACRAVSCGPNEDRDNSKSCLTYTSKIKNNEFKNFSCFSGLDGYYNSENDYHLNYICNTSFELINNLGTTNFNIIPGQKIPGTDGVIATGVLSKYCSFKSNGSTSSISFDPNIIKSVTFNNNELEYKISDINVTKGSSEKKIPINSQQNNYVISDFQNGNTRIDFKYDFFAPEEVYLKKGTGEKVTSSSSVNKYNVGRGIYTKYSLRKSLNGIIPFTISFKNNSSSGGTVTSNHSAGNQIYNNESRFFLLDYNEELDDSKKCHYNWDGQGLFDNCVNCNDKLNIEFRIIDIEKPFVDKNGNIRNTMTNWCYDENRINDSVSTTDSTTGKKEYNRVSGLSIITSTNFQHYYENNGLSNLTDNIKSIFGENSSIFKEGDFYQDGVINNIDAIISQRIIASNPNESSCSYNNPVVDAIISNGPNSYGKKVDDKVNPKYKIVLTPQLIKDIKEQSDDKHLNLEYDKFALSCDSDNVCTSELLTYLKDRGNLTINYSTKRKLS